MKHKDENKRIKPMEEEMEEEKKEISYTSFLAGVMLHFNSIDYYDLIYLIKDFEKRTKKKVEGSWYNAKDVLGGYLNANSEELRIKSIQIKPSQTLESYLWRYNCTLRERLQKIQGEEVRDYFNSINLEKLFEEKKNVLNAYKNNLLENANVLLISENEDDYVELLEYGFKNINYFKSIINANKYFQEHPEELETFHIVIEGYQSIKNNGHYGDIELDKQIENLVKSKKLFKIKLKRYKTDKKGEVLSTSVTEENEWIPYKLEEHDPTDFFDTILENEYHKHTLENIGPNNNSFKQIQEYINPNILPIPTKKEDLKILYLDSKRSDNSRDDIRKRLGLNITFKRDGIDVFRKEVQERLGDYDIIIGSKEFCARLQSMNTESTEQCKRTGRKLTLLASYYYSFLPRLEKEQQDHLGLGSKVIYSYSYGGQLAPDKEEHEIEFRVLRENAAFIKSESSKRSDEEVISCTMAIIGEAVNNYNRALKENGLAEIKEANFKTPEEYDREYEIADKKEADKVIPYSSILAGIMLHQESTSYFDLNYLIEDIEKQTKKKVVGNWETAKGTLKRHLNVKDNIGEAINSFIKERSSLLDKILQPDNCTLREKLQSIEGEVVSEYFKKLDIKRYNNEKRNSYNKNKRNVLTANILLISEIQEDYDKLVKYGFKNIDFFKSSMRAEKHFKEHPEDLKKYHIVLIGNQTIEDYNLETDINSLTKDLKVLKIDFSRYGREKNLTLITDLIDNRNWRRRWDTEEHTYKDFYDRVIDYTYIQHTLERVPLKDKKFEQIKDYINPNRLPIPTKKRDLKILYLESYPNEYDEQIAKKLGLNIEFLEEDTYTIQKQLETKLGDYDIIIGGYHSNILPSLNIESTEQCKDTGRNLTVLVKYQHNSMSFYDGEKTDYDGIGSLVNLEYSFGGDLRSDDEQHTKEFRVLRKHPDFLPLDTPINTYQDEKITNIMATIGEAVNLYNSALENKNKKQIEDAHFKTAEELDEEYKTAEKLEKQKFEDIKSFDRMRSNISKYLKGKRKGVIRKSPEGLEIIENNDAVTVKNVIQGIVKFTVTFKKNYEKEGLRVLEIQTLSKKGKLTNPTTIGLYTRNYESLDSVPNRPDERQRELLEGTYKKVEYYLNKLYQETSQDKPKSRGQKSFYPKPYN